MSNKETFAPGCEHICSGNCRRVGCNCECGEWHGKYETEAGDTSEGWVGSLDENIRDNLVWYKENGTDHQEKGCCHKCGLRKYFETENTRDFKVICYDTSCECHKAGDKPRLSAQIEMEESYRQQAGDTSEGSPNFFERIGNGPTMPIKGIEEDGTLRIDPEELRKYGKLFISKEKLQKVLGELEKNTTLTELDIPWNGALSALRTALLDNK